MKEELLEAAARAYADKTYVCPLNKEGEKRTIPAGQSVPHGYAKHCKTAIRHFISGAKWQAEQMRSLSDVEEEIVNLEKAK